VIVVCDNRVPISSMIWVSKGVGFFVQPIQLSVAQPGTPAVVELSVVAGQACHVYPTSVIANGVVQYVYDSYGCTITATAMPPHSSSNTRYVFVDSTATSLLIIPCSPSSEVSTSTYVECQMSTATIYEQYSIRVSYSVRFGGTPTPPTLTYQAFGKDQTLSLEETPTQVWADVGSPYSSTNRLGGSSSTQQWSSSSASGTVSGSGPLVITYNHQFLVDFLSSPAGDGQVAVNNILTTVVWCNATTTVRIAATPGKGYKFEGWSSSTTSISLNHSDKQAAFATIDGSGTITATFESD
jgi:hypothetical protein